MGLLIGGAITEGHQPNPIGGTPTDGKMNVIRYSMVLDDCDYTLDQLVHGVKAKNAWVQRNIDKFQFRKGYYPKEVVVFSQDPSYFLELADAIDRFLHNRERKE